MSLKLGSTTIHQIHLATSSTKIVPEGVFDIPSRSGTYDVKSYAFARADFEDNLEKRLNGTLTSYSNSSMTIVGTYAFAGTQISKVNLPNVTTLSSGAFRACENLSSISLPKLSSMAGATTFADCVNLYSFSFPLCSTIGVSAFANTGFNILELSSIHTSLAICAFASCKNLWAAAGSSVITISNSAFYNCSNLEEIYFPVCTQIGSYAFQSCHSLVSINTMTNCSIINVSAFAYCSVLGSILFPACLSIASNAFRECRTLENIEFPVCSIIGSSAFIYCYSLSSVLISSCTTLNNSAFYECRNLQALWFPNVSYIGTACFRYCSKLSDLEISSTTMVSLANVNAFYNTTMSNSSYLNGEFGSIYVDFSQVDAYKSATNWTVYSNRIVGWEPFA